MGSSHVREDVWSVFTRGQRRPAGYTVFGLRLEACVASTQGHFGEPAVPSVNGRTSGRRT